jgi:N6-adenosine-specific RNA methylase IME4
MELRQLAANRELVALLEPCSRRAVLKAIENRRRSSATPPPLGEQGTFGLVYADPPWRYEHVATKSRAVENQYPTMTLAELGELDVAAVAAPDCVLFMWATSPKLAEAVWLVDQWGFSYRSSRVWVKDRIGMGYWARARHELLLIGARGNPSPPAEDRRPDSVIEAPRGAHSAKPDLYADLDWQYPGVVKLELFARAGDRSAWWRTWGNDAG